MHAGIQFQCTNSFTKGPFDSKTWKKKESWKPFSFSRESNSHAPPRSNFRGKMSKKVFKKLVPWKVGENFPWKIFAIKQPRVENF